MRISDWSSDVCSSDLFAVENLLPFALKRGSLRNDSGSPARTADIFFENMSKAKWKDSPWEESDMTRFARPHLAHVGIFVRDIPTLEAFYTGVFGLVVTDRGVGKTFRNELVFLSGSSEQHHQLVLSSGRAADAPSTVMQMSFRSEERRVGKEWVRTCRSWWGPYH